MLVSGTLALRISSPTMTSPAVRVIPGLGTGLWPGLELRPARSRRPSASCQAGAKDPSLRCSDLQRGGSGVGSSGGVHGQGCRL